MKKTHTFIQIGTGGRGSCYCQYLNEPLIKEDRIQPVAAVDIIPENLKEAKKGYGLPDEKCYTDLDKALSENEADFVLIVTPPAFHEAAVDAALAYGCDILSEKPIADTLEGSARIAAKVQAAGRKMAVTMSHRFDQDKTTLREEIQSGNHGDLDYLIMRFTCNCRKFGAWGTSFRHTMANPLIIEGSVHHLDILADMGGAKCDTLYAQTWNPQWGEYKGDSQALVTMHLENGVRAFYEGAKTNAKLLNGWSHEYIRAETEKSTLILDNRELTAHTIEASDEIRPEPTTSTINLREQKYWKDTWITEQFCDWLDGGAPSPTNVENNLQSIALIFAAIESSRSGEPINVQEFLQTAKKEVESALRT